MNIDRTVSLMDAGEVAADFDIELADDMKMVAYKSENKITNTGDNAWTKELTAIDICPSQYSHCDAKLHVIKFLTKRIIWLIRGRILPNIFQ